MTRASKVLEQLTGQTPVTSKARYTVRTFSIRRNEKIAVHVTIRGPKAEEMCVGAGVGGADRAASSAASRSRSTSCASATSPRLATLASVSRSTLTWASRCVAVPERRLTAQYDPGIGIFGMDFYVVMGRPGARVAKRKHAKGRIGASHRVRKEDSQAWCVRRPWRCAHSAGSSSASMACCRTSDRVRGLCRRLGILPRVVRSALYGR